MKSLSLTKPLLLVVVGLPGAGKSFFSQQFAETFHAPLIRTDYMHSLLFPRKSISKTSSQVVSNLAMYQLVELFKTQKTSVIDGIGSTKTERNTLHKMATKAGYDTLYIWVQTDNITAKYRSMTRSNRRKSDMYNESLSADQYDTLEKRFMPPAGTENCVVVSGKHTYATQARIVLKKLVKPRESQVEAAGRNQTSSRPALSRNITIR